MFVKFFGASLAAGLLACTSAVRASPVIGLELLIDDSGSITAANYNLQRTGYINALTTFLPTDGSVALGVTQFDGSQHTVFTLQTITAATKNSLINALTNMNQFGGSTATGPSIQTAASNLLAFGGLSKMLIDVSTDGFGNVGINEGTAAANAVAAGIDQVNVLCIGAAANCTFNAGIGSFNISATFANFQSSIDEKLSIELAVPEPASLGLVGVAMLGLAASRRRRV